MVWAPASAAHLNHIPEGLGARCGGVLHHDAVPLASYPQKESQKADEYLREIQELGQLTQAVQQCIEAAGHEHRPDMQKSLLRVGLGYRASGRGTGQGWAGGRGSSPLLPFGSSQAASFGKCFLDRFPPDSFVRMCQDLRVLNAIRDYHIGIPLTYSQYPQAC